MNRSEDEIRINQEASDWLAKHDRELTSEEQDAFFDWLAKDPRNGKAFKSRQKIWKNMNVLTEWRPEHSEEPNPDLLAVPRFGTLRKRSIALAGAAALIALCFFAWRLTSLQSSSESRLLAQGKAATSYERHKLSDGSIVELNKGSQIQIDYKKDRRSMNLIEGEAHFTVAKDESRPFVVKARGAIVQAVGTAFNVALSSNEVEILVTEGRVLVNPEVTESRDIKIVPSEPLVRELEAGQRSVVHTDLEPSPPLVEEVSPEEINQRLAWKSELLVYTGTRLGEIITEFNLRNDVQIALEDEALANQEVSAATLRLDKVDEFLELMTLTQNVQAIRDHSSNQIILRRNW